MGIKNDTIDKRCGERLREARKAAKLSRAELGGRIGYSEVQIGRFERGNNRIPMEAAERLEKVFRIQADYFTGKSDYVTKAEEDAVRKKEAEQEREKWRREHSQDEAEHQKLVAYILRDLGCNAKYFSSHDECAEQVGKTFWELIGISEKLYHVLLEEGWWEERHDTSGWLVDTKLLTEGDYGCCWIEYDVMKSIVYEALNSIDERIREIVYLQTNGYSEFNTKHSIYQIYCEDGEAFADEEDDIDEDADFTDEDYNKDKEDTTTHG